VGLSKSPRLFLSVPGNNQNKNLSIPIDYTHSVSVYVDTMLFCPLDGTLLQIRSGPSSHFYCSTCPYSFRIKATPGMKTLPKRKQVDDILGGATAWENVDRTAAVCPLCSHNEAYFLQIQIRSADEPSTSVICC